MRVVALVIENTLTRYAAELLLIHLEFLSRHDGIVPVDLVIYVASKHRRYRRRLLDTAQCLTGRTCPELLVEEQGLSSLLWDHICIIVEEFQSIGHKH